MDYDKSRINWDTPIDTLRHSVDLAYIDLDEGELMHWKYIKREKMPNGKWRYYYDKDELKKNAKVTVDKIKTDWKSKLDAASDKAISKVNDATSGLNSLVDKAKSVINKFYDDPNNIYNVTRASYTKKLEEVKKTKEWQDIVAKKDSEYVKKNEDGSVTYLVDDYIIDKKHPILDAIDDIVSGRQVTTHEITKDSVVAGLKDYATSAIELGMLTLSFAANGLVKKFKFSQGSYDEDLAQLADTVELGADYLNSMYDSTSNIATNVRNMNEDDLTALVSNSIAQAYPNANRDDIARIVTAVTGTIKAAGSTSDHDEFVRQVSEAAPKLNNKEIENLINTVAKSTASNVSSADIEALASLVSTSAESAKQVNEGNVVKAAQTIMESDALKTQLGSNAYYQQAESVLSNLSDDEIRLLNLLIAQMRS